MPKPTIIEELDFETILVDVKALMVAAFPADQQSAVAAALGLADQLGSITPGKQADLLILSVPDYRMISYRYGTNLVSTVIKKGAVYPAI